MTNPLPIQSAKQKYAIRSILRSSPNHTLLSFDLAQAEAWVVAYLANCSAMKEALKQKGDKDLHSTSARNLYGIPEDVKPTKDQRYIGKKFNHSGNYGTSPMMISHMVNVESINPPYITLSVADAKKLHTKWKELFWEIPLWWESIQRDLGTRRLITPYGRTRTFYGQWGDSLFKEAYAYIPQSTVADHCLGIVQRELGIEGGILHIYEKLVPKGIKILNTAYDSVILDVPAGMEKEIYEEAYSYLSRPVIVNGESITIPVDCEIGTHWGELEKYEG